MRLKPRVAEVVEIDAGAVRHRAGFEPWTVFFYAVGSDLPVLLDPRHGCRRTHQGNGRAHGSEGRRCEPGEPPRRCGPGKPADPRLTRRGSRHAVGYRRQGEGGVLCGLEPLVGMFRQAMSEDAVEHGRRRLPRAGADLRRVEVQDRRQPVRRAFTREGGPPRHHLVEDRAHREQIRTRIGRLSADLLGGHVAWSAHPQTVLRDGGRVAPPTSRVGIALGRAVVPAGHAEVEDLDLAIRGQEDVLRLQVAMDDAARVRRSQAPADLRAQLGGLSPGERAALEALPQRAAFEKLEHDVGIASLRAHVVEGQDVGVAQRGHGTRFLFEPLLTWRAPGLGGREDLQGDRPAEPRVAGPVHLPHAALSEGRDDLVRTETGTSGEGHGCCRPYTRSSHWAAGSPGVINPNGGCAPTP
jgi:hypothetical protein